MASSMEQVLNDLHHVVSEIESLVKSAKDAAGEGVNDAAQGLKDKIEQARNRLSDIEKSAKKNVDRQLRTADRYVRDNAWESLGTTAAVAFLVGFLMGRHD